MFIFLLCLATVTVLPEGRSSGVPVAVPVRSHEVLSRSLSHNQVEQLYDDTLATSGAFYSAYPITAQLRFNLHRDSVLDHVVVTMKREKKIHNISLLVGNLINGKGGLIYACERPDQLIEVYKCQPECTTSDSKRPGIISRSFVMRLEVSSSWISVYDMKVYASPLSVSGDISSNRLVLPADCFSRYWLLTDKSTSASLSVTSVSTSSVYFEKSYIITEIDVQFEKTPPKTLDLVMVSDRNQNHSIVINLQDCSFLKSVFTCKINAETFASRHVQFITPGLIKIFIKGKSVYYPKLNINTSSDVSENLNMTCGYDQCDLSVHSDCSDDSINAGLKFVCVNRRLIRMPSGSDQDSYVIVNHGKVESTWTSTRFAVNSNNHGSMTIVMPRSYQYFGQYKCACILSDKMNTEIFSESTQLKEVDFLEDLFFETSIQYKFSDTDDAVFNNVSNNVIYLSKSKLDGSFITVRIAMFSLVSGNVVNIKYLSESIMEKMTIESSSKHNVKAFDNIQQSWSVETYKYVVDEMFPDFIHENNISIYSVKSESTLKQNYLIKMLDEDKVMLKPVIWSTLDSKTAKVDIMYANSEEVKLYYLEQSCASSNTSVLAIFTKDQCTSLDLRVLCTKYNNAYLLTFKDGTNLARKVILDLQTSKNNEAVEKVTMKNDIILKQEDVTIQARYNTTGTKTRDINVVRVRIDVISKKIDDFILCGNVMIKIKKPNKDMEELILQSSTFFVDVDMVVKEVMVTMEVTIDGAKGNHTSQLKVTDPTMYSVESFVFHGDITLNLFWDSIDDMAKDILESYEIKIDSKVSVCNATQTVVKSIPKSQFPKYNNRYQLSLDSVSQKHMIIMTASIQPIFIGNKKAQVKKINRQFNTISQSLLLIDDVQLTTERSLTVVPSQSDIPCDIKEVQFNVSGINVKKFQWKSVPLDKMKYKITDLVPGRKYELTAQVIYKSGSADIISKKYTFETADDISISSLKHVAQLNERVNISCTADIGPDDIFRKKVQWLRADKSALPDGVISEISVDNPNIAYIIMEKALADYSGEYGCFTNPSAAIGAMTISIVVNDLVVSPAEEQVDFSKNKNILVTCSSSVVGEAKVVWTDPLGMTIPEGDSKQYSMVRTITEQKVEKATLAIKSASLATSGTYKCHKSVGDIKANKEFLLYGSEKLRIENLLMNSSYVGEKRQLRCIAKPGKRDQKVMWEIPTNKDDVVSFVNSSYSNSSIELIQDIEIINSLTIHRVTCKLLPPLKENSEPISASFQIILQSKIKIEGPKKVDVGSNVDLKCYGYPDSTDMQLELIFYSKNTTSKGKVIKVSEKTFSQKSYKPIILQHSITDVKENETGKYECIFKSDSMAGGAQPGQSINLLVNALSKPVDVLDTGINLRKANAWSVSYSFVTTLVMALSVSMMIPSHF